MVSAVKPKKCECDVMRYPRLRISSFLKRFKDDKRGATILIFAITLPVIVGFLGLGGEVAYWYANHRNMQTAADFGAYTAALELQAARGEYTAISQGTVEALENGADATTDTITVNIPPLSGAITSPNAAEMIIVRSLPRLFSGLFIDENMEITARAVARHDIGGTACILALDEYAKNAIDISGTADIDLTGCDVHTNSNHPQAAQVWGNAELFTGCLSAMGGVQDNGGLTMDGCSVAFEGANFSPDPYSDLTVPAENPGCPDEHQGDPVTETDGSKTYSPGRYCGGLQLHDVTTMEPGVYIIDGGDFQINAGADVTGGTTTPGEGVTFIMTGGGTVSFNGTAEIDFTAEMEGDYPGILIYQDREEGDASNKINGNSDSSFVGVFYFPTQEVVFNGNNSTGMGCMHVIGNTVKITGTASFGDTCDPAIHSFHDGTKSAGYVRLVD